MSRRYLLVPALLIFVSPVFAQEESLGDIARQIRSERQQCGAARLRVFTNDDLVRPSSNPAGQKSAKGRASKNGEEGSPADSSVEGAKQAAEGKDAGASNATADKEAEYERRTQEINQQYLDRIAGLRAKIAAAQQDLARLQRDQAESTFQFQRSAGASPSIYEYQEQQRTFSEQIETQRNLIVTLNSQLEDAQESARHAGVPHASD
jgi:hypothetical protein